MSRNGPLCPVLNGVTGKVGLVGKEKATGKPGGFLVRNAGMGRVFRSPIRDYQLVLRTQLPSLIHNVEAAGSKAPM